MKKTKQPWHESELKWANRVHKRAAIIAMIITPPLGILIIYWACRIIWP